MDVNQFIDKWGRADRTERQAAQEHFIDLCRVLGELTPNEAVDPGAYSFEKGASKIDGSPGFADVWKRGHFGWEYKKDRANLDRAYQQLQLYSVALENPPLLVVSDTKRFRIYTNWTNTVQEARLCSRRSDPYRDPRASAQRLPQSGQAEASEDPRAGHEGSGKRIHDHSGAPAHGGRCAREGRAFSQPAGLLPVRRGREPAAGRPVQA